MDDGEPLAMCGISVYDFFIEHMNADEIEGRYVLEVGSLNENGGVRQLVKQFCHPKQYVGVDINPGPNVDYLVNVKNLVERFGRESFDVVISTEMLEHVIDWRAAVSNMKGVLRTGGLIFLTTRSYGFPYHPDPYDCWRYEPGDMERIFRDYVILRNQRDPRNEGVFLKALKPGTSTPPKLETIDLYSVIKGYPVFGIPQPSEMSLGRRMQLGIPRLLMKSFKGYGKYIAV